MASSREFTEYVVDQLGGAGPVQYKKLFGEYGLWLYGKFFGTVEEDVFYVKITAAGTKLLPDAVPVAPHGGTPGMYAVEELDDRDFLRELVLCTCEELSLPKPKPPKPKGLSRKGGKRVENASGNMIE